MPYRLSFMVPEMPHMEGITSAPIALYATKIPKVFNIIDQHIYVKNPEVFKSISIYDDDYNFHIELEPGVKYVSGDPAIKYFKEFKTKWKDMVYYMESFKNIYDSIMNHDN